MSESRDEAHAWQAALAAEQRAVFGYGLLGAHLHGSDRFQLAVDCARAHDALSGATADAIAAAGRTPGPPAIDYPDLYPVTSARQATALAVRLEQSCAGAWRYAYAVAAAATVPMPGAGRTTPLGSRRASAQRALIASAVRATRWRVLSGPAGATLAFPGS